jgi:hypothetical protein
LFKKPTQNQKPTEMFTIFDAETQTRTLISEKNVDYLACDLEECIIRYRNICSPEVFKEYERLIKEEKYHRISANLVHPRQRSYMPHLDRNAEEASEVLKKHIKVHGCNGTLLTKTFPKGDPNYDTFSNSLNHK